MTMQFETKVVNGLISVPTQYMEKLSSPVKVIIVSLHEDNKDEILSKQSTDDGFGSLSEYANPDLRQKEDLAWDLAIKEKYGSN